MWKAGPDSFGLGAHEIERPPSRTRRSMSVRRRIGYAARNAAQMMHPPSLPPDVVARSFVAPNGELGVLPADALAFLDACRADGVAVCGWELWIVDHAWGPGNLPVAEAGAWCGGIPLRGGSVLAIVGGHGDADRSKEQLAAFDMSAEVEPQWLPHVRVNFTLGA
jgi:hypothetical protein